MGNVIAFLAHKGLTGEQNLRAFIDYCRFELDVFGSVDWTANRWNISEWVRLKARRSQVWLNWTTIESTKGRRGDNPPLNQQFGDFARAMLRYTFGMNPSQNITGTPLLALRALEWALVTHTGDGRVEGINEALLNQAANKIKEKWPGSAYQVGNWLERIALFANEKGFVDRRFSWVSPISPDLEAGAHRVGPEADARRARSLPSEFTLNAIARAFVIAAEDRDVLVSSVLAILASAPDRAGEVLDLPIDSVVKVDRDGKSAFGFRWHPTKGGEPQVKWIPATMVDVASTAFARLLSVTEPAREMARWYERNPTKMFLPKGLEHLRTQEYLSNEDARLIMGLAPTTKVFDRFGIPYEWIKGPTGAKQQRSDRAKFSDVETHVIAQLPPGFPVMDATTGLRYSNAVCVVPYRFFKIGKVSQVMFERVTWDHLNREIGGGSSNGQTTLFTRLDLNDEDGKPVVLRTHQLRHWLNTLARKGGLSELDIAKWSGRKSVRQNIAYDHLTKDEMVTLVRKADNGHMYGPIAEFIARAPVSRDEYMSLRVPTAHATEYGVCVHDWTMMPCQKHRDCMNCHEQICIKGDAERNLRVRRSLEIAEIEHKKAIEALADGWEGAGRWESHHYRTLKRLRNLVAIFDDPNVPDGSVIQLSGNDEYAPISHALDEYLALPQSIRDAKVQEVRLYLKQTSATRPAASEEPQS